MFGQGKMPRTELKKNHHLANTLRKENWREPLVFARVEKIVFLDNPTRACTHMGARGGYAPTTRWTLMSKPYRRN